MRLPFSFFVRNTFRQLFEPMLVHYGVMSAENHFRIVRRLEPNPKVEPKFTSDEFADILAATTMVKPEAAWVYHCFVTRWNYDFIPNFIWMINRKRDKKSFSYTSFKQEIEAQLDLRFLGEATDFIRINGEDILDWLKGSASSSTYICLICRRTSHGDSVSVAVEFTNSKDAVAYKLVFG